jgi:putative tryptophan/tyrosine transport system substrate-binding protein
VRRREFIALLGGGVAVAFPAFALEPGKLYRLAGLGTTTRFVERTRAITLPELAKHGFVEGRDLILDMRIGDAEELPRLAQELTSSKPDVILADSTITIRALWDATRTIPIVMAFADDPVRDGLVASLARPGGNVTGVAVLASALNAKRLQVLHEAVPTAHRFAVLVYPGRADPTEQEMRPVAAKTGIDLRIFQVAGADHFQTAFSAMRAAGIEALVMGAGPLFSSNATQLAALARDAGLPTICEFRELAERGCLIGYGADLNELRRRAADYVAKILRGAIPGELPVEGPTHFEFAINLKTAGSLGIELPPSLLARADGVIE